MLRDRCQSLLLIVNSDFHHAKNLLQWKRIKMMKNAFYFMLKAHFVVEIFLFLSWLFGYVGKQFDKKAKFNLKIYGIMDWSTNNYNTHNCPLSRNKGKQIMKFAQWKEYNKNIFLEKSYIKCDVEAIPNPFVNNQNWGYLWIHSLKCCKVCFYFMSKLRSTKIY